MKRRAAWRSFSFVVLVLMLVHLCGASSTYVRPDVVGWPLGPCSIQRDMHSERTIVACFQQEIVQVWPIGSDGQVNAGGVPTP